MRHLRPVMPIGCARMMVEAYLPMASSDATSNLVGFANLQRGLSVMDGPLGLQTGSYNVPNAKVTLLGD